MRMDTDREPHHQRYEIKHRDDFAWETVGWPGQAGKMMFHPRKERRTEPNAGILRLKPGAYHPIHDEDFAQVWYVLEGTFEIDGNIVTPGAMVFHPDPHIVGELSTETGGEILIVQYPGPTTKACPVYDDRFNKKVD